jgi:BTB/POZ domain
MNYDSSSEEEDDVAIVGVRRGGRYVRLREDFVEELSSSDDDDDEVINNNNIIDLNDSSSSSDSDSSASMIFAAASSAPRRGHKRRAVRRGTDQEGALRRRRGDEQGSDADSNGDDDDEEEEEDPGDGNGTTAAGSGGTIGSILAGPEQGGTTAAGDVDGIAGESEDKAFLHFGLDKERSYSDWTITVLPRSEGRSKDPHELEQGADPENDAVMGVREQSYCVHRCVLAVGPRRSLYFRRAFDLPFREQRTSTSTIHLEPLAARAFPHMLEYVYGAAQDSDLDIGTESAVPLRFLARYFEVPALRTVVNQFITKDLSPTNCHVYYRHASVFQDDDMLHAVEALCKIKPLSICHKNPALLEVTDLGFWFRIVRSWRGSALRRRASTMLSHLIRAFRDDFTADRFRDFTDKGRLPVVRGVDLAKDLLRMEKELVAASGSPEGGAGGGGETDLQIRCVDAFARHQRSSTGSAASEKDLTAYLKAQHPLLLGPFLLKILEHERAHKRAAARPIQPPPLLPQQQRPHAPAARYRAAPRALGARRSVPWQDPLLFEDQAPPPPRRQALPLHRQARPLYRYDFGDADLDVAPPMAHVPRQGPPPHPMNLPHPQPGSAGLSRFARDPNRGAPPRRAPMRGPPYF